MIEYVCTIVSTLSIVLAILLSIGSFVSYFPQYYNMMKTKLVDGISESSLFILCTSLTFISANALILNWGKFKCYNHCSFWLCSANLLSVFQILVSWVVVLPMYFIFIRFKIRDSDRRVMRDVQYLFTYIVFVLIMVIVGLVEKSSNNIYFFEVSAKVLGVLAGLLSSIVWIPQIIELIKTKKQGNLSLLMFILQTPGNGIVIFLQILYKQNWTTWFPYVITLVEQGVIVVIILVLKYRDKKQESFYIDNDINDIDSDIINDYDYESV